MRSFQIAETHLQIICGEVSCKNFEHFDFAFNECHCSFIGKSIGELKVDIASASSSFARRQSKSRLQKFRRLQGIFWPTGKRMKVTGIRISIDAGGSTVLHGASSMQSALKQYWEPAHSAQEFDSEKAFVFLKLYGERYGGSFLFSSLESPSTDDLAGAITHSKHSACGFDVVPYAAYKAVLGLAARTLGNTMEA